MVFLDEMSSMSSGQAVGSKAEQEQNNIVQKALVDLNKTLQSIVEDKDEQKNKYLNVIQKLIKKFTGK